VGSLLAAKEFLALGKRDAVDQALRRLVNRGQLVKMTRQIGGDPAPGSPLTVLSGHRPPCQAIRALAWPVPDQVINQP
jgi:hypothetical protein